MIEFFIYGLLLLYFLYFYFYTRVPVRNRPSSYLEDRKRPSYRPKLQHSSEDDDTFEFQVNGLSVWKHPIPHPYEFRDGKIIEKNVCHGKKDGNNVSAEGKLLFDYVKERGLTVDHHHPGGVLLQLLRENHPRVFQEGNVFYFRCFQNNIAGLHMCPSGSVFSRGQCTPLNRCSGHADRTLLHVGNHEKKYIECFEEREIEKECPEDHVFVYDKCISVKDVTISCSVHKDATFQLNATTVVECRDGKPVFRTCPEGQVYFDGRCESGDCVGKPDGHKVAFSNEPDAESRQSLLYSRGFYTCRDGRKVNPFYCPSVWNTQLSKGDDLTHLPMVFDGNQCAVPEFCTNVLPVDENEVYVPVHDYSKHLPQWGLAKRFDSVRAYSCRGNKRQLEALPDGTYISQFKKVRCEEPLDKYPIPDTPKSYYDCTDQTTIQCGGKQKFFNGKDCVNDEPHAFRYKDLSVFKFGNLSELDNWITSWKLHDDPVKKVCTHPESEHLGVYNVCSHPDCTRYPFLSQIPPFFIALPEKGYGCVSSDDRNLIQKITLGDKYDFWTQKMLGEEEEEESPSKESCKVGQLIETGHFVWDKTIYATCDMNQPFVFCPSSKTDGIMKVDDKIYACRIQDDLKFSSYPEKITTLSEFRPNELKTIRKYKGHFDRERKVKIDNKTVIIPNEGLEIDRDKRIELRIPHPAIFDFRYRHSYPPEVVYEDGIPKAGQKSSAFVMDQNGFTDLPVDFPQYRAQAFLDDFKL